MHCWVPSPLFLDLDKAFVKGGLYVIRNFLIIPYTVKYRCFEAGLHLVLTTTSVVLPVMEQWCSIPEEIFGFFNLKNIPAALEQDSNLIGKQKL